MKAQVNVQAVVAALVVAVVVAIIMFYIISKSGNIGIAGIDRLGESIIQTFK